MAWNRKIMFVCQSLGLNECGRSCDVVGCIDSVVWSATQVRQVIGLYDTELALVVMLENPAHWTELS